MKQSKCRKFFSSVGVCLVLLVVASTATAWDDADMCSYWADESFSDYDNGTKHDSTWSTEYLDFTAESTEKFETVGPYSNLGMLVELPSCEWSEIKIRDDNNSEVWRVDLHVFSSSADSVEISAYDADGNKIETQTFDDVSMPSGGGRVQRLSFCADDKCNGQGAGEVQTIKVDHQPGECNDVMISNFRFNGT